MSGASAKRDEQSFAVRSKVAPLDEGDNDVGVEIGVGKRGFVVGQGEQLQQRLRIGPVGIPSSGCCSVA